MAVASTPTVFTLDDLAKALVDANRFETWAASVSTYYVTPGQAFGIDREDRSERARELGYLLNPTLRSMNSFRSPTSGFMEAPHALQEFANRYSEDISIAVVTLDQVLRKMLLDLLQELVEPGRSTVTGQELVSHGFDPAAPSPDWDEW